MSNTGFDRSLGTSKRDQGIVTPQQPTRHSCGCFFRGTQLFSLCVTHTQAVAYAQKLALLQEEEDKQQPPSEPQQPAKPPATPWVEDVATTESVSISLS